MLWVGVQIVSALLFLGYARIGVAAPAVGRLPTARTSGRHTADATDDDDAVTRRLVLVHGGR